MKKIFALLLVCLLGISLVACGGEQSDGDIDQIPDIKDEFETETYAIYKMAQTSGFEGTYEEWLDSLRGKDGKQIELEVVDSYLCWRYVGDTEWIQLYNLGSIQGSGSNEIHTVTFVDSDGNLLGKQEVQHGEKVKKPSYTINGYEITGWTYENELWSFIGYVVTEDMVLTAITAEKSGTIEYITNGGTFTSDYFTTFNTSENKDLPSITKSSYTFDGWYTDSEFTNRVYTTKDLILGNNLLYAKFTLDENNDIEEGTWEYNKSNFDGKGMTIVIYHGDPSELDPFDYNYIGANQKEKQELLNTIEAEYNIDIQIKLYPDEAAWGPSRVAWLNNNFASGNVQGDIYAISSEWIPTLVSGGSIALLSNRRTGEGLFKKLNYTQSYEKTKQYSIGNNVYGYSFGETHADTFLYYNQTLVDQFGLQDPARLWNNGQWDWSTFYAYLQTAQSAFDSATGDDSKIYAFGGFVNDIARGMLAARGGKLIDPDSKLVLFTSTLVLETYDDLRDIWQNDMWAKDSTVADVSNSFSSGRQLFTHGYLWFLSSEQRYNNDQITFEISAVPYPTADGDAANRQTYLIPMGADKGYAIRPVENGENGLNTFVLLNILDDFLRSSESTTSDSLSERDLYILSLQKYISSQQSIDAIMSVEDNIGMYGYTDYMGLVSASLGGGHHWQGSGFCTWGMSLVTSDEEPQVTLDAYKREYQNKLNEILNA